MDLDKGDPSRRISPRTWTVVFKRTYLYDVVPANAFSQSYSTMGLEETYFSGSLLG